MKLFSLSGAIIMAIAVMIVWAMVEHLLHIKNTEEDNKKLFKRTGYKGWGNAFALGLVIGAVIFLSGRIGNVLWLAPVFVAMLLLVYLYLAVRFVGHGDEEPGGENFAEIFWFSVMTLFVYWAMRSPLAVLMILVKSTFWVALLKGMSVAIPVALVIFYFADALYYRYTYPQCKEDEKYAGVLNVLFRVAFLLVLIVLVLGLLIPVVKNWDKAPFRATKQTTAAAEEPPLTIVEPATEPVTTNSESDKEEEFVVRTDDWYLLRHWAVLGGDKADDDNFGENPLDEILAEKVASGDLTVKDISGKTEKELYGLVTFEELFDRFVEELEKDPVKGAAVMGYYDVLRGTNFLGSFSTELLDHKDALMEKINEKAYDWLQDQDEYLKVLTAFVAALQNSDEMEITYASKGLDDQMYMFGLTSDHIPIVVVMESANHSGWFLTFRDYIKGTTKVEVSYRIDCDFQPTNVSKVAKVTVKPNPNKPPVTGGGGGGGTTPVTGGGTPTGGGGGGSRITNPKDPTKGTPVGPNTGNGPGPDTNNGKGATESAAEEPTNSLYENLAEYWDDVDDLKQPTKVAGDSNKPTYTPPAAKTNPPTQDNNGGNGNADKLTPQAPDVTYTDSKGSTRSLDNEKAGEEWEIGL